METNSLKKTVLLLCAAWLAAGAGQAAFPGSVISWGDAIMVPEEAQSGVTAVAARGFYSVALKTNGSVVVWAFFGQINPPATAGIAQAAD